MILIVRVTHAIDIHRCTSTNCFGLLIVFTGKMKLISLPFADEKQKRIYV